MPSSDTDYERKSFKLFEPHTEMRLVKYRVINARDSSTVILIPETADNFFDN